MESTSYETEFTPAEERTMRDLLARNLNQYLICELLVGLRSMTVREGVLVEVGSNYFVLQDPSTGDQTSCDLYSLRFVTVPAGGAPRAQTASGCGCAGGYSPYTYGKPPCRSHGTTACWMRVD